MLGDTVRLGLAFNPGGVLRLGSSLPDRWRWIVFVVLNCGMLFGIVLFLLVRPVRRGVYCSLLLILAGGIGNLVDRIVNQGQVIDFLNVGIGSLRTGVFNVADIAVTIGGLGLLWHSRRELAVDSTPESVTV
jgi:signal peptidase II